MANRYDDETMKFIETRKRVAHMRREEARRKRNIMIAIIAAVVLVVLIVVIAVAAGCGCGKGEEPTTAPATTAEETTVEETTEEEETSAEDFAEGTKAYINEEGVNLREEASTDSEVVDQLSKGTEVTVVANEDEWIKVKVNGNEGYVKSEFLSTEKLSSGSDSDDSDDSNSGNDSNNSDNNERQIETRKRTINNNSNKASSNTKKKSNKNDKRTLY